MKKIFNDEILIQIMGIMVFIFCLIGAEAKTLLISGICFVLGALVLVPFIWMCLRYENDVDDYNF